MVVREFLQQSRRRFLVGDGTVEIPRQAADPAAETARFVAADAGDLLMFQYRGNYQRLDLLFKRLYQP